MLLAKNSMSISYLKFIALIWRRGGNMAVVDLGHIRVTSELQPSNINLEDATQMELEERLYDRFHIDFSELQVLFCDSGL